MSILELFCHVDDFCQWMATWENAKQLGMGRKRGPAARLNMSEQMTILIHFHQSHYRDFKAFYTLHVCKHLCNEFPGLVSYTRFVELMPSALAALVFLPPESVRPDNGYRLYRFDPNSGLPQQAHPHASGLC